MNNVDIIVLCAVKNEFDSVRLILTEKIQDKYDIDNLKCIKGTIQGYNCIVALTGPYMENCETGLLKILSRYNTRIVLLFGAAGAINPKLAIGTITIPSSVIRYESSDFLKGIYKEISLSFISEHLGKFPNILITRAGTSPYFVSSKKLRREIFSKLQIDTTDCETYYVARICKEQNIPFLAIRCITDNAGTWAEYLYFFRARKVLKTGAQVIYRLIQSKSL